MVNIKFDFPTTVGGQVEMEVKCSNGHKQKIKVELESSLKTHSTKIKAKKVKCKKCGEEIIVGNKPKSKLPRIVKE